MASRLSNLLLNARGGVLKIVDCDVCMSVPFCILFHKKNLLEGLYLSTSYKFYYNDVIVTSFINIKYSDDEIKYLP